MFKFVEDLDALFWIILGSNTKWPEMTTAVLEALTDTFLCPTSSKTCGRKLKKQLNWVLCLDKNRLGNK